MEFDAITNLISTVGFPIFCVVALGFFIYKSYDKITAQNKEREEKLYAMLESYSKELYKLSNAFSENTKILEIMKGDIDDIKDTVKDLKE